MVDYELVACAEQADMAPVLVALALEAGITIRYHASTWDKFEDGTDNIIVGGFSPQNFMRNSHVIFLASFSTNDTILSQYHALIMLSEAFVESLTVVLPYYPHGTMERVIREGQIATANTIARMFSNLPLCGKPTRVSVVCVDGWVCVWVWVGGVLVEECVYDVPCAALLPCVVLRRVCVEYHEPCAVCVCRVAS